MNLLRAEKDIYLKGPFTALPERIVSNQEVLNWMNSTQSPTLVSFSTGIRNRRWVNENQACSDLAVLAAEKLFAAKPTEKNKINQIILATISGDYLAPPTSPLVQHRLGLQNTGAFDIGAACAGFVVGLHTSAAITQASMGSILLIASEIRSKFLNKNNFATSVLFGDGAAACVVSTDKKMLNFVLLPPLYLLMAKSVIRYLFLQEVHDCLQHIAKTQSCFTSRLKKIPLYSSKQYMVWLMEQKNSSKH